MAKRSSRYERVDVYIGFDRRGREAYIGISKDVESRWSQHEATGDKPAIHRWEVVES